MSSPFKVHTTRRKFLATAGAAVVGGAALQVGQAGQGQGSGIWPAADARSIVLHDAQLRLPANISTRLLAQGARIVALEGDPVRLWRSDLEAQLRHPQARLFGLTRWADLVIVRGLATESRKHLRHEQLSDETGYLTWLIA